jgi:acetyltransferase-like isoleucine patch superfamily enzyme
MITENNKPIKVIGYSESSMVESVMNMILAKTQNTIEVIIPEVFLNLENKFDYQYLVAFCIDTELRKKICEEIDNLNLDCITYVDDTSLVSNTCTLGKGVAIGPFSSTLYETHIGNHCWIESYCLVAHHVHLGRACVLHSGVAIAGKTIIGENCTFKFKSSVLNHLSIVDDVTVGAFSNVTKDITKPGRYVGSIARYIGE